jgi:hypothetical protein
MLTESVIRDIIRHGFLTGIPSLARYPVNRLFPQVISFHILAPKILLTPLL